MTVIFNWKYFNSSFSKVEIFHSYYDAQSNLFREWKVLVNTLNMWKFFQVTVSERAETVDIVRYLLSYTYSSSDSYSEDKELIDSAVRNIMAELVSFCGLSQSSSFAESTPKQSSLSQHGRISRPPGQNIEMKRGDWICTRYSDSTIIFVIFQLCFAHFLSLKRQPTN